LGQEIASWKVYRAFLRSGDPKAVAEDLGISQGELEQLQATNPEVAYAADAAMADRLPACFEALSEESKAYWEILNSTKSAPDVKQAALIAIANNGERERQKLLAYGLLTNHFDVQSACKALNVPLKQFQKWMQNDPEFIEMIGEIQQAKLYFIESKLFQLISVGSEKATIFAAERLMKDRYGAKIEVSGNIDHKHEHTQTLDLSNLPVEIRGQILDLLRCSGQTDPDGLLSLDATAVKRLN
jgi:hypothetical protein